MERMLKRLSVSFFLAAFIVVFSAGLLVAQPAPTGPRHSLSEICDNCTWEKVATCGGFLEGPSFDKAGQLFMVSCIAGDILKVEKDKCVSITKTAGPGGSKFHKDGRLFITDRSAGIVSIDTKTGTKTTVVDSFDNKPFKGTNDLIFDANGGLYFTDPAGSNALKRDGRVFYLPPGPGAKPQLMYSGIAYPNGIALSPDGQKLYIGEFLMNRIITVPIVNPKNKLESPGVFANLEGIIGPDGLAVDKEGNVYTAHMGSGDIAIFDPMGFKYGALRLPEGAGPFATNLTFHNGYLYVTEAIKGEVWRIKLKKAGLPLYGD